MPFTSMKMSQFDQRKAFIFQTALTVLGILSFRLSAWTIFDSSIGFSSDSIELVNRLLQLIVLLLLLVLDRRVSYGRNIILCATGISAIAISIASIIFLFSDNNAATYAAVALHGAGSAMLLVGWGILTCSMPPKRSAFSLTLAFALCGVVTLVLADAPASLLRILVILVPVISFLLFEIAYSIDLSNEVPDQPLSRQLFSKMPWAVILLLFVCMLSSVLAKMLVPASLAIRSSYPFRLLWPAIMVSIFLIHIALSRFSKCSSRTILWPMLAIIILSGLLCYTTLATTQPAFANAFLSATQDCLMLFCWIVVAEITYKNNFPKAFMFITSIVIFVRPPAIISPALLTLIPSLSSNESTQLAAGISAIFVFILAVLTVIATLVDATSKARRNSTQTMSEDYQKLSIEERIRQLSEDYKLTQREAEVALCLAKGYTLPQTASTLFISLDTVRSHSKKLYTKLGIHKKQELIELIEQDVF